MMSWPGEACPQQMDSHAHAHKLRALVRKPVASADEEDKGCDLAEDFRFYSQGIG